MRAGWTKGRERGRLTALVTTGSSEDDLLFYVRRHGILPAPHTSECCMRIYSAFLGESHMGPS